MRTRASVGGLSVNAIAGTHVVFFGMDLADARRPGFRGFGLKRIDHVEGETEWLRGIKTFEATEPHPARGESFSTRWHPVQSFQWADYSAKPGREYSYSIVALYGAPAELAEEIEASVDVRTEDETGPTHSAFFNRGSSATQEYAHRFENKPPSVAGPGAYEWLSRGLLEALVAFIDRAGPGWAIRGAVYEFQWLSVLEALKTAHGRGADVKVLFDDIGGTDDESEGAADNGPWRNNRAAIASARIKSLCQGRANGRLMHNKFLILVRNGRPKAVWTGSTNLTENGIFGQSNVGHIVEDESVAAASLAYWERLSADPRVVADYRAANMTESPAPPQPWEAATSVVFSPRGTRLDALEWYAAIARGADKALCMTFAFGMDQRFKDVYRQNDDRLRMALMQSVYSSPQTKERDTRDIQRIRNRPNVVVAVGKRIVTNSFDRWLAELPRVNNRVRNAWVHTKYMIVDPLGPSPVVVSGSANFSKPSTESNDENMLIIRGDPRIADIYFGEYMRLYNHYAFREAVKRYMDATGARTPREWTPQYLQDDDAWMDDYFNPADRTARRARREYFSGPMSI